MKTTDTNSNDLGMQLYWKFTDSAIEATPDKPGVFAFFDAGGKLILLGSTTRSLRATFLSHWKGVEGSGTCGASFVSWEQSSSPIQREAELVASYVKKFGQIPQRRKG